METGRQGGIVMSDGARKQKRVREGVDRESVSE